MDRRSLIKQAGIAGILAAGVAPAVQAQTAVRWRLAANSAIFKLNYIYRVSGFSGGRLVVLRTNYSCVSGTASPMS